MSISPEERKKMKKAYSIGDKIVDYLELIDIEKLSDLKDADPYEVALAIDEVLGKKHMSGHSLAIEALENLIILANDEG